MRPLTALLIVMTAAACNRDPAPTEAPKREAHPATVTTPSRSVQMDARDQYAFAAEVSAAQNADLEDDPNAYHRVWMSWNGKRYQWELAYMPLLCRSAQACVMAPFDHARSEKRIVQGWLPRLSLDDAAHQSLQTQCQYKKRCIVTVEGTMSLTLSSQEPTAIAFEQARIVSARDAAADESWIVARR